ncbi:Na+/H+ antiporter subunit E [Pelagicoccus sp. SDUM812002]|uniref:Na+/H+ antiporter subunit E n=1 Tax=Pelagicoccus sp. SDUM812002 TaxID=3041266 RepID=UPI00280E280C|nr:Na+/H+ antiporter subunit E [Pelagicoccus sp. SDUM812002]MDQ8185484.1 Na+/H+ antiporter subunit E [Pelagicoccus sp. SDUM812002]
MPLSVAGGLFFLWALLSGKFDVFHLSVGALSVGLLYWLQSRLPAIRKPGEKGLRLLPATAYLFWLFYQMLVSAWYVARCILGPQSRIQPKLFRFRCPMPSQVDAVIFANSITLTPGTLSVDLEGDFFLVHAITSDTEKDVLGGDMARRVARLSDKEANVSIERMPVEEGLTAET